MNKTRKSKCDKYLFHEYLMRTFEAQSMVLSEQWHLMQLKLMFLLSSGLQGCWKVNIYHGQHSSQNKVVYKSMPVMETNQVFYRRVVKGWMYLGKQHSPPTPFPYRAQFHLPTTSCSFYVLYVRESATPHPGLQSVCHVRSLSSS